MKRFIIRLILFSIICTIPMGFVFTLADGTTDPFYLRFATPHQQSLILGSSRAAQGLRPEYLDSVLRKKWPAINMFNYAFTRIHSPYGRVYYESIQKKLDPQTRDGVFILSVDPWTLSSNTPDDTTRFEEEEMCVGSTRFVNMHPNVEYLLNSYSDTFAAIIQHRIAGNANLLLHKDGWYELNIGMTPDSVTYRTERGLRHFENLVKRYKMVAVRIRYLEKTIEFLKLHGSVIL